MKRATVFMLGAFDITFTLWRTRYRATLGTPEMRKWVIYSGFATARHPVQYSPGFVAPSYPALFPRPRFESHRSPSQLQENLVGERG